MSTAAKTSKAHKSPAHAATPAERLTGLLLGRASAEDIAAYGDGALKRSGELAYAALRKHRRGESVIAIDSDPSISRLGRPVSVVTLVNDNMPFLFDSAMGE